MHLTKLRICKSIKRRFSRRDPDIFLIGLRKVIEDASVEVEFKDKEYLLELIKSYFVTSKDF